MVILESDNYGLITPGKFGAGESVSLETLVRPTFQAELFTFKTQADDRVIFSGFIWPYTLIYVFGYSISIFLSKTLKKEIHDKGSQFFHSKNDSYKIHFQKDRNYIICSIHFSSGFIIDNLDEMGQSICAGWEKQSPVFYYNRSKISDRESMERISMLMLPEIADLQDDFVRDELARAILVDYLLETGSSFHPSTLSARQLDNFYKERDSLVGFALHNKSISGLLQLSSINQAALFRKRLRQLYDMNIRDFITEIRMAAAMSLLRDQTLSIKEIAVKTGFSNAFYFSRVFTSYFGSSPKYFRHKHMI